jgi:peptidoglycan/LPS O-acetylase OafA/YrhL
MPSPSRHANNFDFLRLIAALTVIFSHSFLIAQGHQKNEPLVWASHNQCPLGLVGVFVFFIMRAFAERPSQAALRCAALPASIRRLFPTD